jgi:hypothetical protein
VDAEEAQSKAGETGKKRIADRSCVYEGACLLFAEPYDDAGAKPQIVLAVVETVGDFGHEVLGLYGADRDVLGHFEINAAARDARTSPVARALSPCSVFSASDRRLV